MYLYTKLYDISFDTKHKCLVQNLVSINKNFIIENSFYVQHDMNQTLYNVCLQGILYLNKGDIITVSLNYGILKIKMFGDNAKCKFEMVKCS